MKHRILVRGVSVKGPQHIRSKKSNQDSFMIKDLKCGKVAVVADGMGSCKYARVGSRAICEAVCESCEIWSRYKKPQLALLFQMIMNLWYLKISPLPKEQCKTTCMFVFYNYDGDVIIAQVGDGIIAYKHGDEFNIFFEKEDDFSNETLSVSKITKLSQWNIKRFNVKKEERFSLFICTDGISEDLIPEKREDFLEALLNLYKDRSSWKKDARLPKLLKKWPTPKHGDDKTIVVFHKPKYR